jgi:hypothetical protein
MIGLGGLIARD